MTDLEMTKLCAEAMGYTIVRCPTGAGDEALLAGPIKQLNSIRQGNSLAMVEYEGELMFDRYAYQTNHISIDEPRYDPLHDDAQAMALLKKFPVACQPAIRDYQDDAICGRPADLNRAIVECIAQMMAAK